MRRAIELAQFARPRSSPNPWVGAVLVPRGVDVPEPAETESGWAGTYEGATEPPGGRHAEMVAMEAAGAAAKGATLYSTLEPCCHHGRTPPCTDAIAAAGVSRVVVAIRDPDPKVAGKGLEELARRGVAVEEGVLADEVEEQLAPYLKHRRTGRPFVVLKLAATLDGRIAAPDGSSRFVTGEAARLDAHRLRELSDAVLVGAGTIRADDPELTVRLGRDARQPLRVVLGSAPEGARARPLLEMSGDLGDVLDELGQRGVLQLLVEGGSKVAHEFHAAGLVDRYVLYLAPALMGGDDGLPMFAGPGAPSISEVWRGRVLSFSKLGSDLRVELAPREAREDAA